MAVQQNHYKADQYRSPYLNQDVTAGRSDPISRWVRYFRRRADLQAVRTLQMLTTVCGQKAEGGRRKAEEQGTLEMEAAIENSLEAEENDSAIDEKLTESLRQSLAAFAQTVVGSSPSPQRGSLIVNPHSFPQEANVPPSALRLPPSPLPLPSLGFAWFDPAATPAAATVEKKGWFGMRKVQALPALAEENVLHNEFFEVRFDPQTGGIRTISDYHSRGPRLAQQIALRLPNTGDGGGDENYSIMAADELTVTSSGPMLGEIQSRGRLMDRQGRRLAGFRQTTRARLGSRVIEIEIELDIDQQPGPNPWQSYYASRFAWKDEKATLTRDVNLANVPTELTQFEAPHFVDIVRDKQHTTLLTGGLPYHRRFGRKLDTLLAVQGERARSFRLGIAIDVPHPLSAALGFLMPPLILPDQPSPPTTTGWLFHLDRRNVLATHWESLVDDGFAESPLSLRERARVRAVEQADSPQPSPPAPLPMGEGSTEKEPSRELTAPGNVGFRVRLLETDGRSVEFSLRCFRRVASAFKINPGDVPPVELETEGDCIHVSLGPHQWIEVEGRFAS